MIYKCLLSGFYLHLFDFFKVPNENVRTENEEKRDNDDVITYFIKEESNHSSKNNSI